MSWIRAPKMLILTVLLAIIMGCDLTQIGQLGGSGGDVYGDRYRDEIVGEIRSVNPRQREIELRTDDRRTRVVKYDDQTRVIYRERDYSVSNLEPGDYVAARVQADRSGYIYTDMVQVRESVQERSGGSSRRSRVERIQGTVEYVDSTRGEFEIRDEDGRRVMVTLPYNPRRADIDRLRQLRRGDSVRIEGQFLNADRFELEAFV